MLDYFTFNKVYRTLLVIQILMIATVEWSLNTPWIYAINICISMMCEGAITSILPTETMKHFGKTRGSTVYSFMFSSFGVSAITGSILVSLLQYKIGFTGMLYICMGLTLVSFLLTIIYRSDSMFKYSRLYKKQVSSTTPEIHSMYTPVDS